MQRYITIARYTGFNIECATADLSRAESAAQNAVNYRGAQWAIVMDEDANVLLHLIPDPAVQYELKGEAA
jgi:hypothetical protein